MPADNEITEIIINKLKEIAPSDTEIGPQTAIMGELGLDSLAVMNLIMWLEDTLDVSVPMESIVEVESVADLARALQSLGAGGSR